MFRIPDRAFGRQVKTFGNDSKSKFYLTSNLRVLYFSSNILLHNHQLKLHQPLDQKLFLQLMDYYEKNLFDQVVYQILQYVEK